VILVGEVALWVALLMAAWGAIVAFAGGSARRTDLIESGVRSVYAAFACVVLAISGLLTALVTSDFSFRFVASFTTANLPLGYKVAALWSGPPGALLFCTFALSTCAAIVVAARSERDEQWTSYVGGALSVIMLVFVATLCFAANPYERVVPTPIEGQGMYPLLQHAGFALHAPAFYLGSVVTAVPFALTVAAIAGGRTDDGWSFAVRRWTIGSWFLLTIGMITGMWWAYVAVADAGHWAVNPVRSWSILPWLTTAAFIRSTSRRMSRARVVLALSGFLLAVLGTFIVRGGIIADAPVASWPAVSEWFMAFLAMSVLLVAYLLATRLPRLELQSVRRPADGTRRRFAKLVAQAGLVILIAAIIGSRFSRAVDITLGAGETAAITDPFGDRLEFTSQGVSRFDVLNRHVVAVAVQAQEGNATELIITEERQYIDSRGVHTYNPSIEAGIDYSLKQDVSIVLTGVMGDRARMRIAFSPLAMWVWIGGAMIAVGGAMAMWSESG
jgi:cytochrome c biogenesis factor